MKPRVELAFDSRCELGEGVVWSAREQSVYWTDIHRRALLCLRLDDRRFRQWALPDRLGSLAFCESGALILAMAKGLYLASPDDGHDDLALRPLVQFEQDDLRLRANDGRADRHGNFVFGTLNEDPARAPIGSFYQYSLRHGLRRLDLGGVAIPNSICFSLDGYTLHYCDTLSGHIMRCAYDPETSRVSDAQVFVDVGRAGADGSTIDAQGRLWNAQWNAGRVACYGLDGELQCAIDVPVPQPSCLCFGGSSLDRLLVTTAREDLSADVLARYPGAGGLFVIDMPDLRGMPESRFDDTDLPARTETT